MNELPQNQKKKISTNFEFLVGIRDPVMCFVTLYVKRIHKEINKKSFGVQK